MKSNSLLFILEPDALTVANTGEPFTRKGVISICSMDLSAKRSDEHRTPQDIYEGESLIESITTKQLDIYRIDPNRLRGDINHEERISQDYGGRFIWELLQNADDAADAKRRNQKLIGTKGLGFKSVLEISDEPEIYSGKFCFHFSAQKSQKELQKIDNRLPEKHVPIFRLPHSKSPNENIQALIEEGYSTIIRLPLKTDKKELVKQRLAELKSTCLLFCQCLNTIEIRTEEPDRQFTIKRPLACYKATAIQLTGDNETTHWRLWREEKKVDKENQISVAICLPLSNKKIVPYEGVPKLHVFFPTEERVENVHALIHASAELDSNRKHLQTEQPNQQALCESLKSLMQQILSEIPPDTALLAFGRSNSSGAGSMVDELGKIMTDTVSETAFIPVIGGNKVKPSEVKLWEHGLGHVLLEESMHGENLCDPKLIDVEQCGQILRTLKAADINAKEHAELLRLCRHSTSSDCVKAWQVALLLMEQNDECEKHLCEAPFWWTTDGKARAADGKIPLLWIKSKDFPERFEVDVIDKKFKQTIESNIEVNKKQYLDKQQHWENPMSGKVEPLKRDDYFTHVLLPHCEDREADWWKRHGWEILDIAITWPRKEVKQNRRSSTIYLPVGKEANKWMPAWQCYAGQKWGGPKIFDQYFVKVVDRGVLSPPDSWSIYITKENKNKWQDFLSWIGCSWEPKIVQRSNVHFFDYFDELVAIENKTSLLECANKMYSDATRFMTIDIRVLTQLKEKNWVPCKPSLLYPCSKFAPKDVYMPGCGLGGLFPEVGKGIWEDTLKALDAHDSLPDDADTFHEYMTRLSGVKPDKNENFLWRKKNGKRGKIAHAADVIFNVYKNKKFSESIPDDQNIPCLQYTEKGERVHFVETRYVLWADESYFDEPAVRMEILKQKTLNVFFRFLKYGEGFGLKKLSVSLDMTPKYGDVISKETRCMKERYQQRCDVLKLATGAKLPNPDSLTITAYNDITLQSNTHESIAPRVRFYVASDTDIHINVGTRNDIWRGLAAALADIGDYQGSNCRDYMSDFELLLMEDSWENLMGRLRDNYQQPEEAIYALRWPPLPGTHVSHSPAAGTAGHRGVSYPTESDVHRNAERKLDSTLSRPLPQIQVEDYGYALLGASVGGGSGGGGSGGVAGESQEIGTLGENALCKWLRKKYPESAVTNKNDEQPNHPGYDILVQRTNGEQHYYECKTTTLPTPPRHVELTMIEYEKAQEEKKQYWLCVIYNVADDPAKMLPPICDPAGSVKGKPASWRVNLDDSPAIDV